MNFETVFGESMQPPPFLQPRNVPIRVYWGAGGLGMSLFEANGNARIE
jgi:hypothetical protein